MHTNSFSVDGLAPALVGALPSHESPRCELVSLGDVCPQAWAALAERAVAPNAFFHPAWARAVSDHVRGRSGAQALLAWDSPSRKRLIGFLPVVSAWQALKIPIPILVAWQPFAPLTVPLLDRDAVDAAARGLIEAADRAGAPGILLPLIASESASAQALHRAAADFGIVPQVMNAHARALLDATQQADAAVRNSLSAKKLKELRRQRNRLADGGDVTFAIASSPADVAAALEGFLELEASGWKGKQGTALAKEAHHVAFIRRAVSELAANSNAQVATLARNGSPIAAGILLRHRRRAYFFKIAYDEAVAKMSPGLQLCLDVTRYLCADPAIEDADSTAVENHPMIDHIWRGRLQIADVLVPTRPGALPFKLCAGAVAAHGTARQTARHILHTVRSRKRSSP
jgi:CelD/BcsL family acetyltransferase involved in cellulose biosynthesis